MTTGRLNKLVQEVKAPLVTLVKQIIRESSIHIVFYSNEVGQTSSVFRK